MKYIISIALFINFSLCYSQDYKFDLLTKYIANQEGRETEKIVYSNSDNPNYFLFVKTDGKNLAYLSDLKNGVVHQLHFNEHKKMEKSTFHSTLLSQKKLNPSP